jgi:DNA topoisomerase-1
MTKLLIVESPAKCKKIQGFLGSGWRVQATMGHIRALKEDLTAIGFDAAKGQTQIWSPSYEAIKTKRDAISSLKKAAAGAEVYLGADDDREGEAIAWHTCQILGLDPATTPRVTFHEITEQALKQAVASPGRINMNKFNAQQARTMLDMLIGFTLSPCLWRSVGYKPGLSAGRCQTPALRIIYDRDVAIEAHQTSMSWRLKIISDHNLEWVNGEAKTEEEAAATLKTLASHTPQTLTIQDRSERVSTSQPPKPFITSSLQQEASNRLSMNPKVTMKIAQTLYEGGHITYMRTDNAILSEEAKAAASAIVTERWGAEYLDSAEKPKKIVKKKVQAAHETSAKAEVTARVLTSQNAHEASAKASATCAPIGAHEGIRPTHFDITDPDVDAHQLKLYKLIWNRSIQSVMAPEQRDVVKLTGHPTNKSELLALETTWDQTRFAGWRIIDAERKAEEETAAAALYEARTALKKGQQIPWLLASATEVRTTPPSRYTEASLIRELESKGIGRPSTYATLVETVLDRGYVEKATIKAEPVQVRGLELKAGAKAAKATTKTEKSGGEKDKLRTTPLGRTVIEWLLTKFGDMLEYDFTAGMESRLDEVAKGSRPWNTVLQDTWSTYADRYKEIMAAPKVAEGETTSANKREFGETPTAIAGGVTPSVFSSAGTKHFGDGYKMIVSKKGPLFVLEAENQKTRFASVPGHLSIQTATRKDAEAAFTPTTQEAIGDYEGSPVTIKKGPYGYYASWKEHKVNCKADETLEELIPKLEAKVNTIDHTVGPYKIRKGPYGLYMFKTGTKGKPTFVSIPEATPWATLTTESAEKLYKSNVTSKARAKPSANKEKDS